MHALTVHSLLCKVGERTLSVRLRPRRLAVEGSNRRENLLQSRVAEKGGCIEGERMIGTHSKWRASASPAKEGSDE